MKRGFLACVRTISSSMGVLFTGGHWSKDMGTMAGCAKSNCRLVYIGSMKM